MRFLLAVVGLFGLLTATSCALGGPGAGAPSVPNRIAYLGLDEQVYSIALEGGDSRRLSAVPGETPMAIGKRAARWPTWSPDGSRLAFMRFDFGAGDELTASIFVSGADGSGLSRIFESDREAPIYMAWSPDGLRLTVLTQIEAERRLRLQLLDPSGASPPREVASGGTVYFAWSPDGQRLVLHVNGDARSNDRAALQLLQPSQAEGSPAALGIRPTDFRAPSWSTNGGRLAFAVQAPEGQSALAVAEPGSEPVRLAILRTEPAFLWSPTGDRLAFSSRSPGLQLIYRGIETVRADGSDPQRVATEDVAAFYWSPDGKRLAFAAVDRGNQSLTWFVCEPDGKNRRQLGNFVPSGYQLFMLAFFDQYAQSHGVWTPDSKYLIYAGGTIDPSRPRTFDPLPIASLDDDQPSQVFVVAADGNSPQRVLVDGSLAVGPVPPRPR